MGGGDFGGTAARPVAEMMGWVWNPTDKAWMQGDMRIHPTVNDKWMISHQGKYLPGTFAGLRKPRWRSPRRANVLTRHDGRRLAIAMPGDTTARGTLPGQHPLIFWPLFSLTPSDRPSGRPRRAPYLAGALSFRALWCAERFFAGTVLAIGRDTCPHQRPDCQSATLMALFVRDLRASWTAAPQEAVSPPWRLRKALLTSGGRRGSRDL
jgi:hypothetical protein